MVKHKTENQKLSKLIIGAIGVVYGDIGTSPLYALKACFTTYGLAISTPNIFGILSLIIWSLFIVVSLKYICLIMRADNHGEGGVLTLTTLCARNKASKMHKIIFSLGILATAFFYGDGVITPAISVISALEGLSVISSDFNPYIVPLSVALLIVLFVAQKKGSSKIGATFGPIMIIWFVLIGILGLVQIVKTPNILHALNPYYGFSFLLEHKLAGLLTFGTIVLVLTGAEALYADLGHFNKKSIRISWFALIFPSLILNYCGQGALLLNDPKTIENSFYLLMPHAGLVPLVIISTLATIIASQSIISGVFSLSWQAIQLGFLPRMQVIHTSAQNIGQVYVPAVNYIMMILTIITTILFKHSANLASAYGITVTGTMLCTTILAAICAIDNWRWGRGKILAIFGPLLIIDLIFFGTNLQKFIEGGWLALSIAAIMCIIIYTWRQGQQTLSQQTHIEKDNLQNFVKQAVEKSIITIPGTAVFMNHFPKRVPRALINHLHHNKFLHEKIIFLSIIVKAVPRIAEKERISLSLLETNIYQLIAYYGFTEVPSVQTIIDNSKEYGIDIPLKHASFFLTRDILIACKKSYLAHLQEKLFIFLFRNAPSDRDFFKIPYSQVIELGIPIMNEET